MNNKTLRELVVKVCGEVDFDIREIMFRKDSDRYEGWELLDSPVLTIIEWQRLRNEKTKIIK